LTEYLGLKQLATKYELGTFDLKMCKISKELGRKTAKNFVITTDGQWQLEFPSLLVERKSISVRGCGC